MADHDSSAYGLSVSPLQEAQPPLQPSDLPDAPGFEEPLGVGEEQAQDQVDHTRYTKLAMAIDETGWLPLVRAAYEDEKKTNNTFIQDCTLEQWTEWADDVLATVEPAVLKAICYGNLHETYKSNLPLRGILDSYFKRSDDQATIYIRQMTIGLKDEAMTVQQARDLALLAQQYANAVDSNLAARQAYTIDKRELKDNWHTKDTKDGKRYFIQDRYGDVDTGKKRVLLSFARALLRLADQAVKSDHTHIRFLHYVGYAIKGSTRKKQHDSMTSTSWLFKFTKHAIQSGKGNPSVDMHNYTICLISEEAAGPVAEMLLTRLAHAYYFAGAGFSIGQAGASMKSIKMSTLTQQQKENKWAENIMFVTNKTNYTKNFRAEIELRKHLRRKGYEDSLREKQNQIAKFRSEVEELRAFAQGMRAQMDEELWKEEFPEQYKMVEDIEAYVKEASGQ
jgi:hypothetical protein